MSQDLLADLQPVEDFNNPAPWILDPEEQILPEARSPIVVLEAVQAPLAMLQNQADESFQALRLQTVKLVGWDFLSTLEQAYAL